MNKILHLIPDEKVTDKVIENFENIFDGNIFFVLTNENDEKLKYCKTKQNNVIFANSIFFSEVNVDQDVVGVVIHGLNYVFSKFILRLPHKIKIAWFAWGFDVYNLPKIVDKLYAPLTLKYLKKQDFKFSAINKIKKEKILRNFYYKYVNKTDDYYTAYESVHKRIDFFCTYIKEDYELFTRYYPHKLVYKEIGYFSINQYLAGQVDLKVKTNASNILIGNSNSVENNHLDVFDFLKTIDFQGKAIVPLSYGDNDNYKETIITKGREVFNEKFHPLLEFMDRESYLRGLSGCSTAIFYHYRQQAMGNILALLYMGVRVYLSDKNPIYHYLKRIGIVVYNFDSDFKLYTNSILENDKQKLNCMVLDEMFSKDVLHLQYVELVEKLLDVDK